MVLQTVQTLKMYHLVVVSIYRVVQLSPQSNRRTFSELLKENPCLLAIFVSGFFQLICFYGSFMLLHVSVFSVFYGQAIFHCMAVSHSYELFTFKVITDSEGLFFCHFAVVFLCVMFLCSLLSLFLFFEFFFKVYFDYLLISFICLLFTYFLSGYDGDCR